MRNDDALLNLNKSVAIVWHYGGWTHDPAEAKTAIRTSSPCISQAAAPVNAFAPCPADLDDNGIINFSDILMALG